jgi:hypothetical protein
MVFNAAYFDTEVRWWRRPYNSSRWSHQIQKMLPRRFIRFLPPNGVKYEKPCDVPNHSKPLYEARENIIECVDTTFQSKVQRQKAGNVNETKLT